MFMIVGEDEGDASLLYLTLDSQSGAWVGSVRRTGSFAVQAYELLSAGPTKHR